MDLSAALIKNIADLPPDDGSPVDFRFDLLDWIAKSRLLKISVVERELQMRQKYHRFAVRGDAEGDIFFGYGRSTDIRTAAAIAVNELLERFVSRSALSQSFFAPLAVTIEGGKIEIGNATKSAAFPTQGLHSSNGWAVHFSAHAAIENATREALERHSLLLSYLKHGWSGFSFNQPISFAGATLIPGIARVEVGGFKAGIVLTCGPKAKGTTFGYLCDAGGELENSPRWPGAFFESYEQWIDLSEFAPDSSSVIELYQRHYLSEEHPQLPTEVATKTVIPRAIGELAVFNLQTALKSPFPLFAAFVYGGDLVPLFLRQKLSKLEVESVQSQLVKFGITEALPEFHPIL